MRACLLLLLAAVIPAWPNACALSGNYNLSQSGGHWTGTGCTGASYIPASPDTVTIAATYKLVVDQNWTIGSSPANNGTAAIKLSAANNSGGASLEVQGGATLTVHGDILYDAWTNSGSYVSWNVMTMDAGSKLVFDSSTASSPGSTRYRFGWDGANGAIGTGTFVSNGTACSGEPNFACATHVAVTSNTGGLAGQFRSGTNAVGATASYGMRLNVAYTDFSNIGDAATYGESVIFAEYTGDGGTQSIAHNTWNNCGPWGSAGQVAWSSAMTVNVTNNMWLNTPSGVTSNLLVNTDPTGTATLNGNVFDKCFGWTMNQKAMVLNGNYFNHICSGGIGTSQPAADNFIHQDIDIGGNPLVFGGNMTGGYFFLDYPSDNPHWIQWGAAASQAYNNMVFEPTEDVTTDSGEINGAFYSGSSGAYTDTFNNNFVLPTKTGRSCCELASLTHYQPADTSLTINENHNTWVGATAIGAFAMQQTNESGAALVPVAKMESNLAWSNGGAYCKVGTVQQSNLLQNPITTADYNYADGNAIQDGTVAACSDSACTNGNCVNQGHSYIGKWSATPGAHDVDVVHPNATHPSFADASRNVPSWDTAYLKKAVGAAWASGANYTAGQIVSDSHAGYYGGAAINFRCIANHTSDATTEPNVGANWRNDWEFASLYDLRTATAGGVNYVDGAIGCAAGCTAIQALEGWVKRGYVPQNPALWCAGHDGEAVGAAPFCQIGKAFLGSLAGM